jgi:hypothetical protein
LFLFLSFFMVVVFEDDIYWEISMLGMWLYVLYSSILSNYFSSDFRLSELIVARPDSRDWALYISSACVSKRTYNSVLTYLFFADTRSSTFKSLPRTDLSLRLRLAGELFPLLTIDSLMRGRLSREEFPLSMSHDEALGSTAFFGRG